MPSSRRPRDRVPDPAPPLMRRGIAVERLAAAPVDYIPCMDQGVDDDGLTAHGLWAWAWVLGIVAVGCLLRLASYAADGTPVQTELFVWLLLGAIAGAFSACCA